MTELRLTEEQARQISEASSHSIQILDPDGKLLGRFQPEITPEFAAELKRRARSRGPWYTGEQVTRRLHALEVEKNRLGHLDENHIEEILDRLEQEDPGFMRPESKA